MSLQISDVSALDNFIAVSVVIASVQRGRLKLLLAIDDVNVRCQVRLMRFNTQFCLSFIASKLHVSVGRCLVTFTYTQLRCICRAAERRTHGDVTDEQH